MREKCKEKNKLENKRRKNSSTGAIRKKKSLYQVLYRSAQSNKVFN